MLKVIVILLIHVVGGNKLIGSSSDLINIRIDNGPAYIFSEKRYGNKELFPFPESYSICGPQKKTPGGASFTVEHMLELNCRIPLHLHIRADDLFTAYFNGEEFCSGDSHLLFFHCPIPDSSACGANNLTIVVTNGHGQVNKTHASSVSYQVEQTNDQQCEAEQCPKPLTWYPYPACSCQCGYTSLCGPGINWNGQYSTYRYSHLK